LNGAVSFQRVDWRQGPRSYRQTRNHWYLELSHVLWRSQ